MPRSARSSLNGVIRSVIALALVGAGCQADTDDLGADATIQEPDVTSRSTPPPSSDSTSSDSTSNDSSDSTSNDSTDSASEVPASTVDATGSVPSYDPTAVTSSLPDDVLTTTTVRPPTAPVSGATETIYTVGMVDPGLAPFVAIAVDDLADRLDVPGDSIDVLTAVLVVWPNGALGCPEPGRAYTQVTTDGSVIELGVDDVVYRYHSGGSHTPFPCDRPLVPVPSPA